MEPRPSNWPGGVLKPESRLVYRPDNFTIPAILYLAIQFIIPLLLLPLDTSILLSTAFINRFRFISSPEETKRQLLLRDPRFYPKTILITGVGTVRGLKLSRQFYYGGHRVVGADVGLLPVRSGGSMSNTIFTYYSLSKTQYISGLLDIINREKVDLWIPYSDRVTPVEDGMAKSVVESRTACRCLHVNIDYATLFNQNDSFLQHISERGLPAAENKVVQSRDSLHRILNQSPDKAYLIYSPSKGSARDAIHLPKNSRSQTYSDVSALAISKDNPWVLKQRARLGKYWADLVLVRGQVKAIKIRPLRVQETENPESTMEKGLYEAIRRLMNNFAGMSSPRMSGHLSVKLMVDEGITNNSVRFTVYICGCRQGSSAVCGLLDDPPPDLYSLYMDLITPETNGVLAPSQVQSFAKFKAPQTGLSYATVSDELRISSPWIVEIKRILSENLGRLQYAVDPLVLLVRRVHSLALLDYARFSTLDPLPWWWHYHVNQPLNTLLSIFYGDVEVSARKYS